MKIPDGAKEQAVRLEKVCSVEATLSVIGGKWKPLVLYHLLRSTHRFSELRRLIPCVTQQMLTQQLRELERDGVVRREVYAQIPPKVEYSLTERGRSLEPVLLQMAAWGERYLREETERTEAQATQREEANNGYRNP